MRFLHKDIIGVEGRDDEDPDPGICQRPGEAGDDANLVDLRLFDADENPLQVSSHASNTESVSYVNGQDWKAGQTTFEAIGLERNVPDLAEPGADAAAPEAEREVTPVEPVPAVHDRRGRIVFSERLLDSRAAQGDEIYLTIDKTIQHQNNGSETITTWSHHLDCQGSIAQCHQRPFDFNLILHAF